MKKQYSITYDFGTGSVKAALIDSQQDVLAWDSVPYRMHFPEPEMAVQKVVDYWECFCRVSKDLMKRANVSPEEIKGIAISQTTCTVIFVDENHQHLNDCVTWIDNRGVKQAEELNAKAGKDWTHSKRIPSKILWFMQNKPDLMEKAKYILDVSAYFYLRLTGETAYDLTAAAATDLADTEKMCWDDWAIDMIGMPRSLLPDRIIRGYEKVGEMMPGVAEEAGFAPRTPVFGGCSDNANGHIGANCIRPNDAHLYMGSSGWISVTVPLPSQCPNLLPSAVPGIGYDYYCTDSVGTSIDYMISQYYRKELDDPNVDDVYRVVSEEVIATEDHLEDVIFMPFICGEEEPVLDPYVRGTMLNVTPTTTRGHIARAFMEGIAFNFRWIKENLQSRGNWNINFLRAIGGGVQSDVHLQIIADVMDEEIIRLKNPRVAGNVGLTACVDIGLGLAEDFTILDQYVKEERKFVPRPEYKERYDRLFAIYKKSYEALKDIYVELNH